MTLPISLSMTETIEVVLLGSAPMLIVVLFLLLALMSLRMRAHGKSERMRRAEQGQTGIGETTWDAMQGATTAEVEAAAQAEAGSRP